MPRTRDRRRLLRPAAGVDASTVIADLQRELQELQRTALQAVDAPRRQNPIADLVDGTGGTPTNALEELTTLTDSPASADALRDDLNTNWHGEIEDAIASLAAKVNEVIEALRGYGVIGR